MPFSALTMLMFASAAVLISLMILFSFVTGIFDHQWRLEGSLQAVLAEESALDALQYDLIGGNISDLADLPDYELAGYRTSFQMMRITSTQPEVFHLISGGPRIIEAVPVGEHIFVISDSDEGLKIDLVRPMGASEEQESVCIKGFSDDYRAAVAAVLDGRPVLFIADDEGSGVRIAMVSMVDDPVFFHVELPIPGPAELISAGSFEGEPAVLFSDGYNTGSLFLTSSDSVFDVSSPTGTTPYLFDGISFFGALGDAFEEDSRFRVSRVVSSDYTGDGIDDMVFIGPGSICLCSGKTGEIFIDVVSGGTLVAWGSAEDTGMLSARWIVNGSHERWRIFLHQVFMDSPGPEYLPYPWEGRVEYSRQSMMGSFRGQVVQANEYTGEVTTLCDTGSAVFCQLNGNGTDLMSVKNDSIGIFIDRLDGNGLLLTLRSSTRDDMGNLMNEDLWDLRIFGFEGVKRVYCERVG